MTKAVHELDDVNRLAGAAAAPDSLLQNYSSFAVGKQQHSHHSTDGALFVRFFDAHSSTTSRGKGVGGAATLCN